MSVVTEFDTITGYFEKEWSFVADYYTIQFANDDDQRIELTRKRKYDSDYNSIVIISTKAGLKTARGQALIILYDDHDDETNVTLSELDEFFDNLAGNT